MKAYTLLALVPLTLSSSQTAAAQELKQNIQSQPSMGPAQEHIDQMEVYMKEMSKDMAEIRLLLDPYERKVRLQRHMQSMAKMMREMHRIRPKMSPSETAAHLRMVEKRVDMLQYLIDQILQSQMVKEGLFKTYD